MMFELSIIPTAQQRARHTRSGMAYKSREQDANERTLEALLLCHKPEKPLCGPVKLDFTAYMPDTCVDLQKAQSGHAGRENRAHHQAGRG